MSHKEGPFVKIKSWKLKISHSQNLSTSKITNYIWYGDTYQNKLLCDDSNVNWKKFWKYIKSICKDQHGIAPLIVDGTIINNSKDKAEALNCQFQSVFTREDLTHLPSCNDLLHSVICDIIISVDGVLNLLKSLDTKKVPSPDKIPACVLKLCADDIASTLTVIFTQSLNTGFVY